MIFQDLYLEPCTGGDIGDEKAELADERQLLQVRDSRDSDIAGHRNGYKYI
jgi:hypothetical protein